MKNPDKYIRKYFNDTFHDFSVNGYRIPWYDFHIPSNMDKYVLMQSQSKVRNYDNKCHTKSWTCNINLDIVTIYPGKSGSRLFADDIMEGIIDEVETNVVAVSNYKVNDLTYRHLQDIYLPTPTQSIFRKIFEFEIILTELIPAPAP